MIVDLPGLTIAGFIDASIKSNFQLSASINGMIIALFFVLRVPGDDYGQSNLHACITRAHRLDLAGTVAFSHEPTTVIERA